tara:strand:- start:3679 stop:6447 length:2769 start_codon:yes stop_codon:yes gene_type:complete
MSFATKLAEELARGIRERSQDRKDLIKENLNIARTTGLTRFSKLLGDKTQYGAYIDQLKSEYPAQISDEEYLALAAGKGGTDLKTIVDTVMTSKKAGNRKLTAEDLRAMVDLNNYTFEGTGMDLNKGLSQLAGTYFDIDSRDTEKPSDKRTFKNLLAAGLAINPQRDVDRYLEKAEYMGFPVQQLISSIGFTGKGNIEGFESVRTGEGLEAIRTKTSGKDNLNTGKSLFRYSINQSLANAIAKSMNIDEPINTSEEFGDLKILGTLPADAKAKIKAQVLSSSEYLYAVAGETFEAIRDMYPNDRLAIKAIHNEIIKGGNIEENLLSLQGRSTINIETDDDDVITSSDIGKATDQTKQAIPSGGEEVEEKIVTPTVEKLGDIIGSSTNLEINNQLETNNIDMNTVLTPNQKAAVISAINQDTIIPDIILQQLKKKTEDTLDEEKEIETKPKVEAPKVDTSNLTPASVVKPEEIEKEETIFQKAMNFVKSDPAEPFVKPVLDAAKSRLDKILEPILQEPTSGKLLTSKLDAKQPIITKEGVDSVIETLKDLYQEYKPIITESPTLKAFAEKTNSVLKSAQELRKFDEVTGNRNLDIVTKDFVVSKVNEASIALADFTRKEIEEINTPRFGASTTPLQNITQSYSSLKTTLNNVSEDIASYIDNTEVKINKAVNREIKEAAENIKLEYSQFEETPFYKKVADIASTTLNVMKPLNNPFAVDTSADIKNIKESAKNLETKINVAVNREIKEAGENIRLELGMAKNSKTFKAIENAFKQSLKTLKALYTPFTESEDAVATTARAMLPISNPSQIFPALTDAIVDRIKNNKKENAARIVRNSIREVESELLGTNRPSGLMRPTNTILNYFSNRYGSGDNVVPPKPELPSFSSLFKGTTSKEEQNRIAEARDAWDKKYGNEYNNDGSKK